MQNQKGFYITLATSTAITVALSVAIFIMMFNVNESMEKLVKSSGKLDSQVSSLIQIQDEQETTAQEEIFMLKEYNGIIGVFNESGTLTDIIEVEIKSLPRQDQTMLGTGIWAFSRQELAALIEDFTG
jgi:hypothetical protein